MKNLLDCVLASVNRHRHQTCFRYVEKGQWKSLNWIEMWDRVRELALGLKALGIEPGDRVAILAGTRYEWTLADLAILSLGAVTVPIYPSSTAEQVAYILGNSEAKAVFLEDGDQLEKVARNRRGLKSLESLIVISGKTPGHALSLEDVVAKGLGQSESSWERGISSIGPEHVATIVYTSGTTGAPKGAVLTHGNFLKEGVTFLELFPLKEGHVALIFLPLAHIFARVIQFWQLAAGYTQAYARSLESVPEDLAAIRPHFFASVPRIFEKIQEKIQAAAKSASTAQRAVGQMAPFLVSRKIRKIFGGRLLFAISGGAPLQAELAAFFAGHGVKILEGYGLTETTAGIFINTPRSIRLGTVGKVVSGMKARIARDGEIQLKGAMVFQGYYRDPVATRKAFTRDGWFKTGDIGEIDKDGFLKITDRKKDLIITAAGKNIAPQNIEGLLKTVPYISHVMVHGDQRKYLTALVTLNRDVVSAWMARQKFKLNGYRSLGEHPEVKHLIRHAIEEKNRKLASYETIKRFKILDSDFSPEGGELTPTLKLKRKFVSQKYKDVLDQLYLSKEHPNLT